MNPARIISAASIAFLAVAPALAQETANAPRQPSVTTLTSAWVGYAAMALIAALILFISLRGSKRSDQKDS